MTGTFYAALSHGPRVTLRWTVISLADVKGFNVYRGLSSNGPFERINNQILPAESPGVFEDRDIWAGAWFWYELTAVMSDDSEEMMSQDSVAIEVEGTLKTRICSVSPNPFRSEIILHYDIACDHGDVRLSICDLAGRVVKTFRRTRATPGSHSVTWDGTNDAGEQVASGVYFCSVEAGGESHGRSLVFLPDDLS